MDKKGLFLILFFILFLCSGCGEKELYCDGLYTLIDDQCVYEDVIFANVEESYYCNSSVYNEQLVGTECVWYSYYPASLKNECPVYYQEYGSRCRLTGGQRSSSCRRDQLLWFNRCYAEYVYPTSKSYYCTVGELYGSQCVEKYSYKALINYTYTCPFGYNKVDGYDRLCARTLYESPKER